MSEVREEFADLYEEASESIKTASKRLGQKIAMYEFVGGQPDDDSIAWLTVSEFAQDPNITPEDVAWMEEHELLSHPMVRLYEGYVLTFETGERQQAMHAQYQAEAAALGVEEDGPGIGEILDRLMSLVESLHVESK